VLAGDVRLNGKRYHEGESWENLTQRFILEAAKKGHQLALVAGHPDISITAAVSS